MCSSDCLYQDGPKNVSEEVFLTGLRLSRMQAGLYLSGERDEQGRACIHSLLSTVEAEAAGSQ